MSSGFKKLPVVGGGGAGLPGGPVDGVQYNDNGTLNADTRFKWDSAAGALDLNGLEIRALSSSVSLVDNQSSPVTVITYSATNYQASIIEFSLTRNGEVKVGRAYVANNASNVSIAWDGTSTAELGVDFTADISAGNVIIQYTTTNTGFNAFLRYSIRQWA